MCSYKATPLPLETFADEAISFQLLLTSVLSSEQNRMDLPLKLMCSYNVTHEACAAWFADTDAGKHAKQIW